MGDEHGPPVVGRGGAAVALGLRQTLDEPVLVELFDPLKGERWACAVA
jgi:hypothetical protein